MEPDDPCNEVFSIPELLVPILLNGSYTDLLQWQWVCKHWSDTIAASPEYAVAFCFKPPRLAAHQIHKPPGMAHLKPPALTILRTLSPYNFCTLARASMKEGAFVLNPDLQVLFADAVQSSGRNWEHRWRIELVALLGAVEYRPDVWNYMQVTQPPSYDFEISLYFELQTSDGSNDSQQRLRWSYYPWDPEQDTSDDRKNGRGFFGMFGLENDHGVTVAQVMDFVPDGALKFAKLEGQWEAEIDFPSFVFISEDNKHCDWC